MAGSPPSRDQGRCGLGSGDSEGYLGAGAGPWVAAGPAEALGLEASEGSGGAGCSPWFILPRLSQEDCVTYAEDVTFALGIWEVTGARQPGSHVILHSVQASVDC